MTDDCLIIGGGVIGLSLAYELAGHGLKVRVIDRGPIGREASWAGAGILPPGAVREADRPLQQLIGLSHGLHARWAAALREETGIDTGYRRCGGLYVARDPVAAARLADLARQWQDQGIETQWVSTADLCDLEPALACAGQNGDGALLVPAEGQLRTPRHVRALAIACAKRGVELVPEVEAHDFQTRGRRIERVITATGSLAAETVCVTSGAWSGALAARLGLRIPVAPVRGQIALLACARPLLERIVNEGPRYLVPRADGRVLVGSTEEDVGFDRRTTASAIAELLRFAICLAPELGAATLEQSWAGLRPDTADGLPFLGRLPDFENAFIAAGHFRNGLQLSPGTAVVMSQLVRGQTPEIDLAPFGVERSLWQESDRYQPSRGAESYS